MASKSAVGSATVVADASKGKVVKMSALDKQKEKNDMMERISADKIFVAQNEWNDAVIAYGRAVDKLRSPVNMPILIAPEGIVNLKQLYKDCQTNLKWLEKVKNNKNKVYRAELKAKLRQTAENDWKIFDMEYKLAEKKQLAVYKKRSDAYLKGSLQKLIFKLPEDMEQYEIKEFLSYDIRIELLESRYNVSKMLGQMTKCALELMLFKMCNETTYVELLAEEDSANDGMLLGIYQMFGRNTRFRNELDIRKPDAVRAILRVIYRYKSVNTAAAYKWIRMLAIIIRPGKRYYRSVTSYVTRYYA
jgi:hypothetical protein